MPFSVTFTFKTSNFHFHIMTFTFRTSDKMIFKKISHTEPDKILDQGKMKNQNKSDHGKVKTTFTQIKVNTFAHF